MLEVGQPCIVKPVTFNTSLFGHTQPVKGAITYIHPRLRYVTVGIPTEGGQIRESFFPEDVRTELPEKKRKR